MEIKDITNELNEVLTRNYDAIEGYRNAAANIESPSLQSFFNDQAIERTKFAVELSSEIILLGEQPVSEGSLKASAHRTWMDIKSALAANDKKTVIEECIRGEETACEDYEDILTKPLVAGSNLRTVLNNHKRQIQQSISHLKSIEKVG